MARASKRTAKQQYILQVVFGVLLLFLVVGIGWGTHHFTHLPEQQINKVKIEGGDTVNIKDLENLVWGELEGKYIGLIPRANKYLYPRHEVNESLLQYPRVKEVDVVRDDQELSIKFSEYSPYALWCDEELGRCLLVDRDGFSFAEAPQLEGGVMYRFIVENSVLLERSHMLPAPALERTVEFAKSLKEVFGLEVSVITHTAAEDVFYRLQSGAEFRTSLRMEDAATLENLGSILNSDEFSHLTADNFQYIDLRFGNKVYVNEELIK